MPIVLLRFGIPALIGGLALLFGTMGGGNDRSTTLADLPANEGNSIARPPATVPTPPIEMNPPIEIPAPENPFFPPTNPPEEEQPVEISERTVSALAFGVVVVAAFSLRREKK